jgi:hypothetical protein
MRYMLLMYGDEGAWTEEERIECIRESRAICEGLGAKYLAASPLEPARTARTVRVRGGEALVTAGPYTETKELLGGFFLLDLDDLDEAIAVAAKLPPARRGAVEIRPVLGMEGLPAEKPLPADVGEVEGTVYMLVCHDDEAAWREAGAGELARAREEAVGLARELAGAGRYLGAAPLFPSETATCVRLDRGRKVITDGPFAETNEVVGGYYLIAARDQAEALEVAARHPGARKGSVEVRALADLAGLFRGPGENSGEGVESGRA